MVSKLTPLQVDFVSYMDELAGEIGVRPSLPWLFFTDYQLYKRVLWGPVSSYQYRLMGPGKWDGARRAIFTQFGRMTQALKTRKVHNRLLILIPHSENHYMLQMCFSHLIHNVPTNLSRLGGGGKALRCWPPAEVESGSHGWNCLNLLHPCAQPEHNSRSPGQNPPGDNLNIDRLSLGRQQQWKVVKKSCVNCHRSFEMLVPNVLGGSMRVC